MSTNKDIVSHEQQQALSDAEQHARERIEKGLSAASRALARDTTGAYLDAIELLSAAGDGPDVIGAVEQLTERPVTSYSRELHDDDRYDSVALRQLVDNPERLQHRIVSGGWESSAARSVVGQSKTSLAAVVEHESLLGSYTVEDVPATEYEHQVAVRHYRFGSAGGEDVELIDPDDDLKATLLTGGQGSGKSTALKTIVEDRLEHGHKVIDLVDFHKAENATYDIAQQQPDLDEIRQKNDVDVAFEEFERPQQEIVCPLSDTLADSLVPFDGDESPVTPFAIPTSELSYRQLVMLMPHTTATQENYLQSAFLTLNKQGTDWTLSDVATVVRQDTNAGDAVADRIEQSLKRTQQKPYIRDKQGEHVLDWDRIMADSDTVSSFTVHMLGEKSDKLAVTSYLLDKLYGERKRLQHQHKLGQFPPLTSVFRELHTIVPRSRAEQDAENTLESYMIDTFQELIAMMRHVNMEIIADTQKFKQQLDSDVSGLFHRVFAFSGQKPDIKEVFRTRVGRTDASPAEKVSKFDTGECALVNSDGYSMPLSFLPPRSHHPDAKAGEDGFSVRSKYLDEDLEPAPWDTEIPSRLQFGSTSSNPVAKFFDSCVQEVSDDRAFVTKERMTEAFNEFARATGYDTKSHKSVNGWISRNTSLDDGKTTRAGDDDKQEYCWWGVELTL